ncbi:MAG: M4 family metallopeptidase [Bacteroidetes bacterium]|nr:M4 family metallopeptidase [Bacteroidota bacterium]
MNRTTLSRLLNITALGLLLLISPLSAQRSKYAVVEAHRDGERISDSRLHHTAIRFQQWRESNRVLRMYPTLGHISALTIDQILAYERHMREIPELRIAWDDERGIPLLIEGAPLQRSLAPITDGTMSHHLTVKSFLQSFSTLLRIDTEAASFLLERSSIDDRGRSHLRFRQNRNGIPIWGREIVCGIAPDGNLELFTGRYTPVDCPVGGHFILAAEEATAVAQAHLQAVTQCSPIPPLMQGLLDYNGPTVEQCYLDENGTLHPAYAVELRTDALHRWRCFVDAEAGSIIRAYRTTCTDGPEKATATDLTGQTRTLDTYLHSGNYYLIDASRTMFNPGGSVFPDRTFGTITTLTANNSDLTNVTHVTSAANTWSDRSSVSAHANLGLVYEYYRGTHGRNSIDNRGGTILAIVNVTQGGLSMENAYWNGQFMAFGNGGTIFDPIAGALDVTAHELTHGVTEFSAGLEYRNQSGALNEAFSDIFAAMVDRDDWKIGEDITRVSSSFPTGTLRDMQDPHNGGSPGSASWQPKHMNEYQNLPETEDNGGVHINSGIINHCAYLLSEDIGRDKAEKIFYDALTTKLTRQSRFIDFRLAIIRSAQELFGAAEAQSCASACDQVGITDGNPTDDPTDYPEVEGVDRMLFVNTDPFLPAPLWIAVPPATDNDDFTSISFTEVWSRPSISDDGSVAVFIDTEFNIRAIALDGAPNEQVIENSGVWNSIALSRDQNMIALTTILLNPEIYVLDISGPNPVAKSFEVYTPNYTGEDLPNAAQFPDAMEFSHDDAYLLFDTYNEVTIGDFDYGFWDINLMHIRNIEQGGFGTGFIERIFPQDPTLNIGNPTFAKNKPTVIAFDVISPSQGTSSVMAMDLLKGEPKFVAQTTFEHNGYPTYAGDDRTLSYVVKQQDIDIIVNISMESDGITTAGSPQGFIAAGTVPLWFRTGTRPVAVANVPSVPAQATLAQNYPNPFNPSTTIRYTLPVEGSIELTVHDMLGRRVRALESGIREAGGHTIIWDGRDDAGRAVPAGAYFTRFVTDGHVLTRQMLLLK